MKTEKNVKATMTITVEVGGKEIVLTEAEARKLHADLGEFFKVKTVTVEKVVEKIIDRSRPYPFSGPQWSPSIAPDLTPFVRQPEITC